MKIAICYPGHLRDFQKCFLNHHTQFISKLEQTGYTVDYFVSTWDNVGHRSNGWTGKSTTDYMIHTLEPKKCLIEKFDRDFFIQKYNTDKWKEYSHLSDYTTCGDSASMWYKVQTCADMVDEGYDFIVRMRPDLLFDTPFPVELLETMGSSIYIPKWHGKWIEISNTITDYFAIGRYAVMKRYMSVYNNLDKLINENACPHTGEGFLYGHLRGYDIKRLDTVGFSIQRKDNIEKII